MFLINLLGYPIRGIEPEIIYIKFFCLLNCLLEKFFACSLPSFFRSNTAPEKSDSFRVVFPVGIKTGDTDNLFMLIYSYLYFSNFFNTLR